METFRFIYQKFVALSVFCIRQQNILKDIRERYRCVQISELTRYDLIKQNDDLVVFDHFVGSGLQGLKEQICSSYNSIIFLKPFSSAIHTENIRKQ